MRLEYFVTITHVFHYDRIATHWRITTRKNSYWRSQTVHYASIRESFSSFSVASAWSYCLLLMNNSNDFGCSLNVADEGKRSLCQSHLLTVHTSSKISQKILLQNHFSFFKNFWKIFFVQNHFLQFFRKIIF